MVRAGGWEIGENYFRAIAEAQFTPGQKEVSITSYLWFWGSTQGLTYSPHPACT